ncbi:4Fe-4S dicluster domain-containing protein [Natronobacterium gregoryi]|uniref:4Fe-4S ferredoxin n=2 Tax=Natronobacterium gregoryi TaxID=44930 RepID=L0AHR5_NATGS|nr:4Fe-4S dicluster domain-containing protein [Natronobacterium gregoryi]AFZ73453.1 Fe-S-cluster-containing hydrogenase subunit [Natronobacterium gregoryi SP2]ELY68650.1 dimethylsulfoxide reductase subunit B [Natronobacterium gregoryi SP2]PLK20477.1 4Fe-4S ferredoxin [Natronobacterium gregoryi SP2]SFI71596.1 anaerobic dimethyl sulfoxide reductase subunit B (DMSO reductase iron-sulfur subunit) [Natronobacterium gregoryi]
MSEQWGFYFDPEKCMGCHACTVSCRVRNDTDTDGPKWRRMEHVSEGEFPNYEEVSISMSCFHCSEPPCRDVCPTHAIEKRESDGIVTVNQDACIGCHYCGYACPFGAAVYGDDGLLEKCHLCLGEGAGDGHGKPPREREEDGGNTPACVDNCVGDALEAGPINEILRNASEKAAEEYHDRDDSAGAMFVVEPVTSADGESIPTTEPSE